MTESSKQIAELSPQDLDLLISRLEEKAARSEGPILRQRLLDGPQPLSFSQQRLWFLDQLKPGNAAYNIPTAIRIQGLLNIVALEHSLNQVIRRHTILRTMFESSGGEPVQVVRPHTELRLQVVNVGMDDPLGGNQSDALNQACRMIALEACKPFDLAADALIRASLFQLAPNDHILLLVMHHIVFDGWSAGVLLNELMKFYLAFANEEPLTLEDLPIQYADFARWQLERLQGPALESLLSYWRQKLEGAPALLELPADQERPAVQSLRGAAVRFDLSAELTRNLKRLSQQQDVTLFMVLLAAFNVLLFRYTRQTDIVVGSPVASRNQVELENLIGFFVNTVALRTQVSSDLTFIDLLRQVREVTLDAYAHQELPFEKLVEELRVERNLSHTPLVQVVFGLHVPLPAVRTGGLLLSEVEIECTSTKYDLTLSMFDEGEQLCGMLEYSTDLFHPQTATRMTRHFINLLEAVTAGSLQRISCLDLLSEEERKHLLLKSDHEPETELQTAGLHQIFERMVDRYPQSVALKCGNEEISYGELSRRSDRTAELLRTIGVGTESIVGVLLGRSVEMIVALLGILKAGAAYLPLETDMPAERLAYVLSDSGARWVIARELERSKLQPYGIRVVDLENEMPQPGQKAGTHKENFVCWDQAAYVIYTSGSTGKPKGVTVTHRNVARLFASTRPWFNFSETDVWTLYHSYAFDFSVWEMWGALLHGGRLVLVPYGVSRSPEEMLELIRQEGVTVLNQTPSAFRQLMRADERARETQPGRAKDNRLRYVIFGGEALDFHSVKPWLDAYGDESPRLINMYGITETTVHVTYRPLAADEARDGAASCIGVPIPDLQFYILDELLQLAPVGVPGEICIGGPGLARGYLNHAMLTAERFVPNPFSSVPGDRLYRSGDLGRYLNNFDVAYLGRIDHQVKIRGFRIELGEIESLLSQHHAVKQALVMAREEPDGERRLVAYVVHDPENPALGHDLRNYLKRRLPDYMLPSAFVAMERLPLTSNGKVDRRALPAPGASRPEGEQPFVAPQTPVEEALAYIFARVLNIDDPGVDDNFFALGGDSIRSVRVLALARERGLNFSLEQLFAHPTVAELSRIVEVDSVPGPAEQKPRPFDLVHESDRARLPGNLEDAYPLTQGQAGLVYHSMLVPGSSMYHNVDSMCFRVPRFDLDKFQQAVGCVVARHPILRTAFDLKNFSEPLQLVYKQVNLPITFDDLRHLTSSEQKIVLQSYTEVEKHHHFHLEKPPLLRFHVHLLENDIIELTQTEFHAIHDGWSMNSMLVEIFHNYSELLADRPLVETPPPSSTFRDFVALEREALASEDARRFWDSVLDECQPLSLPGDGSEEGRQGRSVVIPIDSGVCDQLTQLARRAAVPFKSILMAAHLKVLSLLSGQSDILTGMVSHGRPEQNGGEQVRGFFLNTLPFREKLKAGSWVELAQQTFRSEIARLPYRRFPLGALQEKWGKAALLETVFNYIDFHVLEGLNLSGVELLGIPYGNNPTHFALSASFNMNKSYWGAAYPDCSLAIFLEYDEHRFSSDFINMAAHFYKEVLNTIAVDPHACHASQSFLPAKQGLVLREWNNTAQPVPFRAVHEMFEELARANPGAIAVNAGKTRITYGELNKRANQLAHYLRRHGVAPGSLVAVLLERSVEMVTALLAILKAGAAYLPLDQTLPAARLRFVVKDAQAKVLLTTSAMEAHAKDCSSRVIFLDAEETKIDREARETVTTWTDPDLLAYVIYTSGSTGTPKGVEIEHRGLTNLVSWHHRTFQLKPADRTTQLSSPLFDATVLELWPCLTAGASLYLPDDATRATPSTLVRWLADNAITVAFLPTVLAEAVLKEMLPGDLRLRILTTGGDRLHKPPSKALPFAFYNLYGPTENSVCATSMLVESSASETAPSIGKPIDNVQVHILDTHLLPVGLGVAGELYIAGASLARGYLRRPELTAEKFVPDPFSDCPGARMYRSGDQARYGMDGNIEFLVRLDSQVKIRGFRIELEDIGTALRQHPALSEATVAVREVDGEKVLVAYFVAMSMPPSVSEIRSYLRERLPEYMVPSAYVQVDRIPLTHSGKIDRAALPQPEFTRSNLDAAFEKPRTELEREITEVWNDILQVESLGIHDNFFDLGGNSIRMIQVHAKLKAVLGAEVAMMDLFHYPTVSALAERLSRQRDENSSLTGGQQRAETRKQLGDKRQILRKRRAEK